MLHHPIYPSHPWRDLPALRERFVPIFDKHHVDFVLQGHDHAYQRTYPLRGHRARRTPAGGTIYLMAVSGDKFVEPDRARLRRSRPIRRLDLSDVRNRLAVEPADLSRLDRGWRRSSTSCRSRSPRGPISLPIASSDHGSHGRRSSAGERIERLLRLEPIHDSPAALAQRHVAIADAPEDHPRQGDPAPPIQPPSIAHRVRSVLHRLTSRNT